jgi:hypothetical protein
MQYQQQMHQYGSQPLMTPVQSPQPMYQKPTILVQQESPYLFSLDTDCYAPSTPPLSTSGSAVSSPPSSAEILPTPVTNTFYGQPGLEMMKGDRGEEVYSEILAGENWNHTASPPMTPGMFNSSLIMIAVYRETTLFVKNFSRHEFKVAIYGCNQSGGLG